MGFSGGGSNILKPHTHNGLTVQDGGALDFDNITQSQSSAGQVFYSDGTHLQQLAYPGVPAGETLTAVAASSAPSWAAAASASTWTVIQEQTVATTVIDTTSLSACDNYTQLAFNCFFTDNDNNEIEIRWYDTNDNLMSTAFYQVCGDYNNSTFQQIDTDSALLTNNIAIAQEAVNIQIRLFNKKGEGSCGGSYSIATYGDGGTGSIYNRAMPAGTGAAIRGFKIVNPATMSNAFWTLMGA